MLNFTSFSMQQHLKNLQSQEVNSGSETISQSHLVGDHYISPAGKNNTQVLPPFEILLSWLSYVYDQTGDWPLPPGTATKEIAPKSDFANLSGFRGKIGTEEQAKEVTGQDDTVRVLKLISDNVPSPAPRQAPNPSSVYFSTGFSYVNSRYFEEAVQVIEKYAIRPIHPELLFGCKLTLSLIIAWCQFPLFNGMNDRQGRWITLASSHCTRELKVRTDSFRQYLAELKEAGLLQTAQAGSTIGVVEPQEIAQLRQDCLNIKSLFGSWAGHYWSERSIQAKSMVYRIPDSVKVSGSLPQFNPFGLPITVPTTTAVQKQAGDMPNKWERPPVSYGDLPGTTSGEEIISGKDQTLNGKDLEEENTFAAGSSRSFPGILCYKLKHDNVDVKHFPNLKQIQAEKNEKSQSLIVAPDLTTPAVASDLAGNTAQTGSFDLLAHLPVALSCDQKDKFEFLTEKARFTGYSNHKDGCDTLDAREALKFALNSELTLEILQEHYAQVKDMWNRGLCYKNPIGLLHWAITRGCDPRGFDNTGSAELAVPNFSRMGKSKGGKGFNSSYLRTPRENKRFRSKVTPVDSHSLYPSSFQKRTVNTAKRASVTGQFYQQEEYPGRSETGLNNNNYLSLQVLPEASSQNNNNNGLKRIVQEEEGDGAKKSLLQPIQSCDELVINSAIRASLYPALPDVSDPAFWEEVKEIDLAGRFRVSKQELELLSGSRLSFTPATGSPENADDKGEEVDTAPQLFVILRSIFEESRLGLTTRSIIQIALRQRLGPGYQLVFSSSRC